MSSKTTTKKREPLFTTAQKQPASSTLTCESQQTPYRRQTV